MSKADLRRVEIVRASALLFEQHGFHNVSVGDIADAVGLSKPALYHYVESKAEILYWIHDDLMAPLLDRMQRNLEERIDPRSGLRQVVVDTIGFMETRPGYLRVYFENQRELPVSFRAEATAGRRRFEEMVIELIARGMDDGLLRQGSPRIVARAFFGITNWTYQWFRPGHADADEVAAELFDTFLHGAATEEGTRTPVPASPTLRDEAAPSSGPFAGMSDRAWEIAESVLPEVNGRRGGQWRDHRQVLDAIHWKTTTNSPWRELPERFGPWRTTYQRFRRWKADGTWDELVRKVEVLASKDPELEWIVSVREAGDGARPK